MPDTIGGFTPVNTRSSPGSGTGRGGTSKLPNTDPSEQPTDPQKEDPNSTPQGRLQCPPVYPPLNPQDLGEVPRRCR
jgi:hypothetical protein